MTTKEILNLYGIEMVNSSIPALLGGGNMESFFMVRNDTEDLKDLILQLQHFMKGNTPPCADGDNLGGLGNLAYIDASSGVVHFNNPYTGEITQTVPLEQFKIITEAWRDFMIANGW